MRYTWFAIFFLLLTQLPGQANEAGDRWKLADQHTGGDAAFTLFVETERTVGRPAFKIETTFDASTFVAVTTMIGYFQLFAEPYVMTQGGPLRSTTTLVLLMYEEGFRWWRMGVASSIAFVLFLLTLAGTLIQLRLRKAKG